MLTKSRINKIVLNARYGRRGNTIEELNELINRIADSLESDYERNISDLICAFEDVPMPLHVQSNSTIC